MQLLPYCPMPQEAGRKVQQFTFRSPRMSFQWWCLLAVRGKVLDVGCCDDPNSFGHRVVHFDYDDWGPFFKERSQCFVQGDAHHLTEYFKPDSFEMVIMGDIVEHLPKPYLACGEAAQVTSKYLCMTIWEEWRGPGGDEQMAYMQQKIEDEAHDKGYESVQAMYAAENPGCIPADDRELSHHTHCQKLTDDDIEGLVAWLCDEYGMSPVYLFKAGEVQHEGWDCYNWLILLKKHPQAHIE